jgi:hypothetical protein
METVMDHHLPHRPLALFALLVIGGSVGCDGGKKSYESCLSYEREQNFELATGFCKQAVSEAPNSSSGKLPPRRFDDQGGRRLDQRLRRRGRHDDPEGLEAEDD